MKQISSLDNKWVKLALSLQKRKNRYKEHRFLTEGFRILEELAALDYMDVLCFVSPTGKDSPRLSSLYDRSQALGWQWYETTEPVYQKMKTTETSQGILGIIPFEEQKIKDHKGTDSGLYLYLHDIQDPGNLGTIIRTAAAVGCPGILLSPGSVDVYNEKVVRSTMGNLFRVPLYQQVGMKELQEFVQMQGLKTIACTMEGAVSYRLLDYSKGAILVLGNEGNGLSPELLSCCQERAYIPMELGVESLNLSVAASLFLYEGYEQKRK